MWRVLAIGLLAVTGFGCGGAVVDTPAERRWNKTEAQAAEALELARAGRYDKAAPLARKALLEFDATGRQSDTRVVGLLVIVGRDAQDRGDWPIVSKSMTRLLSMFELPAPNRLKAYLALGQAHLALHKFEPALAAYDKALPIAIDLAKAAPPDQVIWTSFNGFVFKQTVRGAAPLPGTDIRVAHALAKQAEAYIGLRQPERATPKLKRALTIFEHALGPLAAPPRTCLFLLGQAHRAGGDHEAARLALDRVLESLRGNDLMSSASAAQTYGELGLVAQARGDWATARAHLQKAIALGERAWPEGETTLAEWRAALAAVEKKAAPPASAI